MVRTQTKISESMIRTQTNISESMVRTQTTVMVHTKSVSPWHVIEQAR